MQNLLQIHSENVNLECQRSAWNAEFTVDPQRECECSVPAERVQCRTYYGSSARMRIWSASEALRMRNSLRIHNENANAEFQRSARNAECTTDCEFGVSATRLECRFSCGSTARMRMLSSSGARAMQNLFISLARMRIWNSNEADLTVHPQRECEF